MKFGCFSQQFSPVMFQLTKSINNVSASVQNFTNLWMNARRTHGNGINPLWCKIARMDRDRKQKLLVASELAGSRFNQITNTLLVYVHAYGTKEWKKKKETRHVSIKDCFNWTRKRRTSRERNYALLSSILDCSWCKRIWITSSLKPAKGIINEWRKRERINFQGR